MLKKETILKIENVYTANSFRIGSECFVGAGSETEPVVQLYNMTRKTSEAVDDCPGGMMSFVPVPGKPGLFASVMGLFPPFIGKDAGLYLHKKAEKGWKTKKMLDLPFAHRCEFLQHGEKLILVAATVSRHKENPSDWSRPGEIHVILLNEMEVDGWNSTVMDPVIIRNHGMIKASIDGKESICISGAEGVFSISFTTSGELKTKHLFKHEVSELAIINQVGNGSLALATIEPFHGSTMNLYIRDEDDWKLKYSAPLAFGHGLSGGLFNGKQVIVAGNRDQSRDLQIFTIDNLNKGFINQAVIEADVGPTQTQVFTFGGTDYIMSANQRKNEVALYSGIL